MVMSSYNWSDAAEGPKVSVYLHPADLEVLKDQGQILVPPAGEAGDDYEEVPLAELKIYLSPVD